MAHMYDPTLSSRVNPLRPISKIVLLWIVFAAITGAGFGLLWLLLSLVDVVLGHFVAFNIVYATTLFSIVPWVAAQFGSWLSSPSAKDTFVQRMFRLVGPTALFALLCALYLWADYRQSFH